MILVPCLRATYTRKSQIMKMGQKVSLLMKSTPYSCELTHVRWPSYSSCYPSNLQAALLNNHHYSSCRVIAI